MAGLLFLPDAKRPFPKGGSERVGAGWRRWAVSGGVADEFVVNAVGFLKERVCRVLDGVVVFVVGVCQHAAGFLLGVCYGRGCAIHESIFPNHLFQSKQKAVAFRGLQGGHVFRCEAGVFSQFGRERLDCIHICVEVFPPVFPEKLGVLGDGSAFRLFHRLDNAGDVFARCFSVQAGVLGLVFQNSFEFVRYLDVVRELENVFRFRFLFFFFPVAGWFFAAGRLFRGRRLLVQREVCRVVQRGRGCVVGGTAEGAAPSGGVAGGTLSAGGTSEGDCAGGTAGGGGSCAGATAVPPFGVSLAAARQVRRYGLNSVVVVFMVGMFVLLIEG